MLFNSAIFIFCFLPIALAGFWLANFWSWRAALAWLTAVSFVFYCWWDPVHSWPIVASIAFNYVFGLVLIRVRRTEWGSLALSIGIGANLALLGYFKYANFFLTNLDLATGSNWQFVNVTLPLGISFFTFTQIAYLVDVRRGIASEPSLLNYSLFVTFFPHLIAGPIIHHSDIMPQFNKPRFLDRSCDLAVGTALFVLGLFKKVILADTAAHYAGPAFAAGASHVSLVMAWEGALAYTAQIYFDFSGYSDMAVGLARMFGINLPVNFNSPYKARCIIEFWRRWHITLSRFLRDYLYYPLGGNRLGSTRRYVNLLLVMVLGGLWHGANWTFLAWGGLHGFYLVVNHLWRGWERRPFWPPVVGWFVTLLAVVVGWVVFRAPDLEAAVDVLQGMVGMHGFGRLHNDPGNGSLAGICVGAGLLALAMIAPNTQQLVRKFHPGLTLVEAGWPESLVWQPNALWATVLAVMTVVGILNLWSPTEFLYYQF